MVTYLILVAVVSVIYQLILCIHESVSGYSKQECNEPSYQTLFFNTPEQNELRAKTIRQRQFFRALLSNVGLVVLVVLCYLLCSYLQVLS